jgi:hypothetical protein
MTTTTTPLPDVPLPAGFVARSISPRAVAPRAFSHAGLMSGTRADP